MTLPNKDLVIYFKEKCMGTYDRS